MRRLGLIEITIGGNKLRERCLKYLKEQRLSIDLDGRRGGYDLVVNCTDVTLASNTAGVPLVVVQEGILDPDGPGWQLLRRFPRLFPRWIAGTAATGVSGAYDRFCVASQGYRDLFVSRGAPPERVVVTGIPNFDDCESFRRNDFPLRGYVLVCTSDARETFKPHDRRAFIADALRLAAGRPLVFKLHPNERVERARREILTQVPDARVFADGPTEAMIANADALITNFSSVVFVGIALGKEVYSSHPMAELVRLLPEQNRSAAQRIARVCRDLLQEKGVDLSEIAGDQESAA
jgi:hypothetical protein